MPKKIKGRLGKKKDKTPPIIFDFQPPTILELGHRPSEFVKCRICCSALPHLNFEWPAVPTEVTVGLIKDSILKRHGGGLADIRLYQNVIKEDTEIKDATGCCTLKDLGIKGAYLLGGEQRELPVVTLQYDFWVPLEDDPVASKEPGAISSSYGLSQKTCAQLQK